MSRNLIKPLRQGGLDSLCGVYAIVNAVRLALAPEDRLTRDDALALYATLTEELARLGDLHDAVTDGIEAGLEWPLAKHAVRYLREECQIDVDVRRPFSGRKAMSLAATVKEIARMARDGTAVILEVREWGCHWTVVRGVTEKSLLLLDSAGVKTIRLATCQVGGRAEAGKLVLRAGSIVRVGRGDGAGEG